MEKAVEMFSRQAELARSEPELVNALTYQFVSVFFFFFLFLFALFWPASWFFPCSSYPCSVVSCGPDVMLPDCRTETDELLVLAGHLKSNFCVTIQLWPLSYRSWRRV